MDYHCLFPSKSPCFHAWIGWATMLLNTKINSCCSWAKWRYSEICSFVQYYFSLISYGIIMSQHFDWWFTARSSLCMAFNLVYKKIKKAGCESYVWKKSDSFFDAVKVPPTKHFVTFFVYTDQVLKSRSLLEKWLQYYITVSQTILHGTVCT